MFAVVETGGKQIKAVPGRNIDIEKIPQVKGEKVSLSNVLMLASGKDSKVGNPYIKGATVHGHIVEQGKDDKVIVYKMRPKKGTRKKQGHRQWYTRVYIDSIELDGKVIASVEKREQKQEARSKKQEHKKEEPKLETHIKTESLEETKTKKKTTKKKED